MLVFITNDLVKFKGEHNLLTPGYIVRIPCLTTDGYMVVEDMQEHKESVHHESEFEPMKAFPCCGCGKIVDVGDEEWLCASSWFHSLAHYPVCKQCEAEKLEDDFKQAELEAEAERRNEEALYKYELPRR